mgnify:CR=1 FL=1
MSDENYTDNEQNIVENTNETEINNQDIGKRFVHKKRRERLVRKGRLKQERTHSFIRILLSVCLILGFWYLYRADGWYLNEDAFTNFDGETVEIINNRIVSTAKIQAILKQTDIPNLPVYMAKTNDIKTEILKLKPIENVYIRRYAFPARLQIIVRERIPVISVAPDIKAPATAFFTTDGTLIGREFLPLNSIYKTILVLAYGNKTNDYQNWDLQKIKEIQKIVRYVESYSKESVEYIDFRNPDDVFVKIPSVNIRLGKLDDTLFKRIERLPSILPQVKEVKTKVKYLDLSWEKVNYLKLE